MYQELKIHFDSIPHNLIRKSKWASLAFFSFSYPVRDGHELPIKRSPSPPTHPIGWWVEDDLMKKLFASRGWDVSLGYSPRKN
jgi:hypothetical protein